VNGLRLKSFTFSVRGELVEPQKNTFAIGSGNKNILNFFENYLK
jgi:ATP-dependent protease HslVU (ClpYQ) peptidase subunit